MRPKNLLIYYGWLNSFASAENSWDNENVAQSMSIYNILVFGDGVQNPSHGDFANSQIIIPRIKEINPEALIFGYVTVNQSLNDFTTKVSQWNDLEVDGIFMDEAGYDCKNRIELNSRIDVVHNQEFSNICFLNSWNIDHVMGIENDPSYPNSTYNPGLVDSNICADDWYLLESFVVNTSAYSANDGYANKNDWYARGNKAVERRKEFGIKLASVGIINDDNSNGQDLFDFCYRSALAYSLDANGTSDSNYGASSATTKFWQRPKPYGDGKQEEFNVIMDGHNSDLYLRFFPFMKVLLNFNTKTSAILKW